MHTAYLNNGMIGNVVKVPLKKPITQSLKIAVKCVLSNFGHFADSHQTELLD